MIYVTIAPEPSRKKKADECCKVAFTASGTLVRDIKAASADEQIRSTLIEDIVAEGWLRWKDGARLPASSRGGGHLKIQVWVDKAIVAMAQDIRRAAKTDGGTSTLSAAIRRLLILGLEKEGRP
jgi:hypothetical protein